MMIQPTNLGGFNLVDIPIKDASLKLAWVHRLIHNPEAFWAQELKDKLSVPLEDLLAGNCGLATISFYLKESKTLPPFWKDVFHAWEKYIKVG